MASSSKSGSPNASASGPKPLWAHVDDWPQVPGHLRETLDAELISTHAVASLRRALDFQRVVGFIGSGVSMSYGRLGWGELLRWMAEEDQPQDPPWELGALGPLKVIEQGGGVDSQTAARMKQLLTRLKINEGADLTLDVQSGRYPAAFQFLEQISHNTDPAAESRVRRVLRAMLRDDTGHAYLLLSKMLQDLWRSHRRTDPSCAALFNTSGTACTKLVEKIRSIQREIEARIEQPLQSSRNRQARDPASRNDPPWRNLFTISAPMVASFGKVLKKSSVAQTLCNDIATLLSTTGDGKPAPLPPLHRFIVPALIRLDPGKACKHLLNVSASEAEQREMKRSARIPEGRDPLLMLLRDFGVGRFATTNYDLDIEQALADWGYETASGRQDAKTRPPADLSRNALGVSAHDVVFTHEHPEELLRFACARPSGIEVIHLHGRVGDGEPMVVTEADYQSTYLRRNEQAEAAAEAIALMMRSNTVLFLGSGMSEDDILRPMRQFVTERRSPADRSGVVLLPADGTEAREVEDVIALYSRYGVLTKHFGNGQSDGAPVRWLHESLQHASSLKTLLTHIEVLLLSASSEQAPPKKAKELLQVDGNWPPKNSDRIEVNGKLADQLVVGLGLGDSLNSTVEWKLLMAVERATNTLAAHLSQTHLNGSEYLVVRTVQCLKALLSGLEGALRGLAMMLELASLHAGWLDWKEKRREWPMERAAGAQRRSVDDGQLQPGQATHIFTRTRVALRSLAPSSDSPAVPETDRFWEDAPSFTVDNLTEALRARTGASIQVPRKPDGWIGGRRVYLLLGRRGLGKGHFFERLAERARVATYIEASWTVKGETARTVPAYAVACYVNLGLSLEFLSAFDRLSDALVEMCALVFGNGHPLTGSMPGISTELKRNRLARLQALVKLYCDHAGQAQARVLLAINGFSQLFDRHGAPKNAQVHRLLETLMGVPAERMPIDLLLVSQSDDVPGPFRRDGLRLPITRNTDLDGWSGAHWDAMEPLVEPTSAWRQHKLDRVIDPLNLARPNARFLGSAWVHRLNGARACATVAKYFPEVALAVAFDGESAIPAILVAPLEVRELQQQFAQGLAGMKAPGLDADRLTIWALWELKALIAGATPARAPLDLKTAVDGLLARWPQVRSQLDLEPEEQAMDQRFLDLHHATRSNRFLLTIVCAAAAEQGWRKQGTTLDWSLSLPPITEWLRALRLEVANLLPDDAHEVIIRKVLSSHRATHDRGTRTAFLGLVSSETAIQESLRTLNESLDELWIRVGGCGQRDPDASDALYGPRAWQLQQRLLWHLAVTALEVQADVLAAAPLVEQDCQALVCELLRSTAKKCTVEDLRNCGVCRSLVDLMMDMLVHRCLVFRLEPVRLDSPTSPGAATAPPSHSGWRFSIHRLLQRSILAHFRSPQVELPRVDQFGLSMWATQPDDLPRPHRAAAHDVASLVAAWIGFPDNAGALKTVSAYHWHLHRAEQTLEGARPDTDWRIATLPARMLRAALGVIRATYSVGVVSHFHAFDDDGAGLRAPTDGYFKQHHLQVRWLLEQARQIRSLQQAAAAGASRPQVPQQDHHACQGLLDEAQAPFFKDELVWLNNECGLFCLVEGRLQNAAGMFRQALIAAEQVEAHDQHGALWCRISLNLAIVEIERGQIREAEQRLKAIQDVPDENPILRILARGFLGLIQHLSGQLTPALAIYQAVIADLVSLGQYRSVAIFSRHLAELHRLQGAGAAEAALQAIDQSLAAAARGGHEDVRHMALLSRVRLAIAGGLPTVVQARERLTIQTNLDEIERYGHAMGMPRLLAEVAFARALYLLSLGDARHATRQAYACLGLCGANSLLLRQMMCLALLGRIYLRRKLPNLAQPLLRQAEAMAAEFGYGNLRDSGAGNDLEPDLGR